MVVRVVRGGGTPSCMTVVMAGVGLCIGEKKEGNEEREND